MIVVVMGFLFCRCHDVYVYNAFVVVLIMNLCALVLPKTSTQNRDSEFNKSSNVVISVLHCIRSIFCIVLLFSNYHCLITIMPISSVHKLSFVHFVIMFNFNPILYNLHNNNIYRYIYLCRYPSFLLIVQT